MKTLVFIETNKSGSSRAAIRAAEQLGYYTVLFTSNRRLLTQREELPDVHELIYVNTLDEENMKMRLERLQKQGRMVQGVISFIDSYVTIAMELSEYLGIDGFTLEATRVMEDKILTRQALEGCSANVEFAVYSQEEDIDSFIDQLAISCPCIVKSPSSTGSKDVHLVENTIMLREVMLELLNSFPNQPILIERFIEGPQWLIETIVTDGEVEIIAIIGQEITKGERFIITGYYTILQHDSAFITSLKDTLNSIVRKIGMLKGSCHFELRQEDGTWKLIEVNPRISGGAMNSMVFHSLGINIVEQTLRFYLGLPYDLTPRTQDVVYTYYLTISTKGRILKITGKNRALKEEGIREVYIKPRKGMTVYPPTSMGHRYGYIISAAETKERAKDLALTAAREIRFIIEEQE